MTAGPEQTVWCPRCQEYRALPQKRLCPVCLDDDTRSTTSPPTSIGGPR